MKIKTVGKIQLVLGMIFLILGVIGVGYSHSAYNAVLSNGTDCSIQTMLTVLLFSIIVILLSAILILQGLTNFSKKKAE